jgi:hypothetical protein
MNSDKLQNIENELNIELPEEYKKIQKNYPFDNFSEKTQKMFSGDCKEILEVNTQLRKNGYKENLWPSNFFAIGYAEVSDKNNAIYFINLQKKDSQKIFVAEEDKKFNPKAIGSLKRHDTFAKFIRNLKILESVANI